MKKHFSLFEVYGVELEYMIVDKDTLKARPIADELIKKVTGSYTADVERGAIAWSNELVSHVIELKTNGPARSLEGLDVLFMESVKEIQGLLEEFNAILLPTAMHPFFDPMTETVIWPHEYNEVYSLYNRMFDCKGHGWSNLQSTHINLPFDGDNEFARLHAAVRLLLPIIPALSASSPIVEGEVTEFFDARLEAYRHNQDRIPEIAGHIVPEAVYSKNAYEERIFGPIMAKIRPFDTDGVLDKHFVNSRGAIARFDRGAIEIRIIDIQECPKADLAILEAIIAVLKGIVNERWADLEVVKSWDEKRLKDILVDHMRDGEETVISDSDYLAMFRIDEEQMVSGDLWRQLIADVGLENETLEVILDYGSLAKRMTTALENDDSRDAQERLFRVLANCLSDNELYIP